MANRINVLIGFILVTVVSFGQVNLQANNVELYQKLDSNSFVRPAFKTFSIAVKAYNYAITDSNVKVLKPIITIIDYDLPSTERRLWVIDLESKKILHHILVAHGKNTGNNRALKFSNKIGSHQSSLGSFVTEGMYVGKHGSSLYLKGIEKKWNSNARKRAIVMHTADYVSRSFIMKHGRLGRSHGCPAIPNKEMGIMKEISGNSFLFIYHSSYLISTSY